MKNSTEYLRLLKYLPASSLLSEFSSSKASCIQSQKKTMVAEQPKRNSNLPRLGGER